MNSIAEEILLHYGVSKLDGAPVGSGRYPLGSGENPNQHGSGDWLSRVREMKKPPLSMTEKEIAEYFDMSTTKFRAKYSLARDEERAAKTSMAQFYRNQGLSLNQIAAKMGFKNDSSVRTLLDENAAARMNAAKVTADYLRQVCDDKGMLDVGVGVEKELGVSKEKLRQALEMLKLEGYEVYGGGIPQVTNPGKQINVQVLCPPGTEHKEIYNFDQIHSIQPYDTRLTEQGDKIRPTWEYPTSISSDRVEVLYKEGIGELRDGFIELRRDAPDLSLGESHYAQVRIMVDGTHYIKGLAAPSDNLPPGVDVRFWTNKHEENGKMEALKKISDDPSNPFGALLREEGGQTYYFDKNGVERLSAVNKCRIEGDWGEWSKDLPSQFLAKQSKELASRQLQFAIDDKVDEYNQILSCTNPTVKKELLRSFADDCDASAVHLKAAALPRQQYQVLVPLTTISDNEVYAPNYRNGETVALIRFPHGGTFEIPILTVNNKNKEGENLITANGKDAIGINKNVANRLSGADFDGDTVLVIPTNSKVPIISTPPLTKYGLGDFDSKMYQYDKKTVDSKGVEHYYRNGKEFKIMKNTQNEMGRVSNLITDMTLKGATDEEKARAVMHSMVVIDAEKHKLDYKESERVYRISELKKKYQGHYEEDGKYHEGASTLISRAKAEKSVDKRRGSPIINEDGSLSYKTAFDLYYTDKNGKQVKRTQKSTQMAETSDARTLSTGTVMENIYADYANTMKSMANAARKEMINTGRIEYKASAKATYINEVNTLDAKLNTALKNAPRERQAQAIANSVVNAKRKSFEQMDMTREEINKAIKKERQRALTEARAKVGASRHPIDITDREWQAIQSGAISENKLSQIIKHVDSDKLKERAIPRSSKAISDFKQQRIRNLKAAGYTNAEIADAVGVSVSTVNKYSSE